MKSQTHVEARDAAVSGRRPLRILLVDDEPGFREMAAEHLESIGMDVEQASGSAAALEMLRTRLFDLGVFDLRMTDMDGLKLLSKVKQELPAMEILILTAHGTVETAVEAMRRGAHHFLIKPVKLGELQAALERAGEKVSLNRMREGETAVRDYRRRYRQGEFLATGPKSQSVLDVAVQAAAGAFPVLIQGETGTGKELIAHAIHRHSGRRQGPMVTVNCGIFTENLLERELFGHARGSFTGASESRAGLFEAADGGTLFLDEIGESNPAVQVALLRAIETGMFRRIGEVRERFADVRVIAASNRSLAAEVEARKFRADLYHRLNVVSIPIPPLRERPEEIMPLAKIFLSRLDGALAYAKDAEESLKVYVWPGNVRELQNVIERAFFLRSTAGRNGPESPPRLLTAALLGLPLGALGASSDDPLNLDDAERHHVLSTLEKMGGDKRAAAKALNITLRHLYRKLKKYNRMAA